MKFILKPFVWLGLAIVIAMIAAWSWHYGVIGMAVGAFVIVRGLSRGRADA